MRSLPDTVILNNGGPGEGSSGTNLQAGGWQMRLLASGNIPQAKREWDAEEEAAADGEQECAAAAGIR